VSSARCTRSEVGARGARVGVVVGGRVVDQDVEAVDARGEPFGRVGVGDVERRRTHAGAEPRRDLLGRLGPARRAPDLEARARELAADLHAQAPGPSGDERDARRCGCHGRKSGA
jgi:hypothetical protein